MPQVGTRRTITKMLWTFPESLLLTKFMEEEGVAPNHCPLVWKIEVEIDPMPRGDRRFGPSGQVRFYVVHGDFDRLGDYLYHKIPSGGIGELDTRREVEQRYFVALFKGHHNQHHTTTAIKFCVKLFGQLGLQVLAAPEVYQLTQIVQSIGSSGQCNWISFGQQLWSDEFKGGNK